jgi:hypothetical protein
MIFSFIRRIGNRYANWIVVAIKEEDGWAATPWDRVVDPLTRHRRSLRMEVSLRKSAS